MYGGRCHCRLLLSPRSGPDGDLPGFSVPIHALNSTRVVHPPNSSTAVDLLDPEKEGIGPNRGRSRIKRDECEASTNAILKSGWSTESF
jgi:hypothetical protein